MGLWIRLILKINISTKMFRWTAGAKKLQSAKANFMDFFIVSALVCGKIL